MSSSASEVAFASKILERFLALVLAKPAAELVDLGPVIGSNIAFLGERVDCKIHVEDLYADLDLHARQDMLDRLPEFLGTRVAQRDASVDAVLCWEIFDYLPPAAAGVLVGQLRRVLRPGGALLGFFGGNGPDGMRYTKYVIEDVGRLRASVYQGACRRRMLQNREINNLFTGFELFDSVLRKSGAREVLFRKRA